MDQGTSKHKAQQEPLLRGRLNTETIFEPGDNELKTYKALLKINSNKSESESPEHSKGSNSIDVGKFDAGSSKTRTNLDSAGSLLINPMNSEEQKLNNRITSNPSDKNNTTSSPGMKSQSEFKEQSAFDSINFVPVKFENSSQQKKKGLPSFDCWRESSFPEDSPEIKNSIRVNISNINEMNPEDSTASSFGDDSSEDSDLSILNWASFQRVLKDKYNLIKSEQTLKENLINDIKKLTKEYAEKHLQRREFDDLLKFRLTQEGTLLSESSHLQRKESIKPSEDKLNEMQKKYNLIDPYEALGETTLAAKNMLNKIFRNPKIAVIALRNAPESKISESLEYSLTNQFYHNLMEKGRYEYDLLRLNAELLKDEVAGAKTVSSVLFADTLCRRMLSNYMQRNDFQKYVRILLKSALLKISRDGATLLLDYDSIAKHLKSMKSNVRRSMMEEKPPQKSLVTQSSLPSPKKPDPRASFSSVRDSRMEKDLKYSFLVQASLKEIEEEGQVVRDSILHSEIYHHEDEEIEPPRFERSNSMIGKRRLSTLNPKSVIRQSEMPMSESMPSKPRKASIFEELASLGENSKILSQNLQKLTSYTDLILRSVFDNIYLMPLGIRMVCKLACLLAAQKFEMTKREEHRLAARIIFSSWIVPLLRDPEPHAMADNFAKCKQTSSEVAGLLEHVILQEEYGTSHKLSFLNPYIISFRESIEEYFNELLNISSKTLDGLVVAENVVMEDPKKITLSSFCLSVEEIKFLADQIIANQGQIVKYDQQVGKYAKNVLLYHNECPIYENKLRPDLTFANFSDLKFPKPSGSSYLDEFTRVTGAKDMPKSQRVANQCKYIFKHLLISMEDLKDISTIAYNDEMNIEDILQFCQEEVNTCETKLTKRKEQKSVHLSARLLLGYLKNLDPEYRVNNYQKFYTELLNETNDSFNRCFNRAQKDKIHLMRGIESLRRRIEQLKEENSKRWLTFQRILAREFLNKMTFTICLNSPKIPMSQHQITVQLQDRCPANRVKLMNEMGYNGPDLTDCHHYHCTSVNQFLDCFAKLPAVEEAILYSDSIVIDKSSKQVSDAYNKFLKFLFVNANHITQGMKEEERSAIEKEIEKYVGSRLAARVFPKIDKGDEAFWMRCKTLEWVDIDHLDIPEEMQSHETWDYVASKFAEIDRKLSPVSKLDKLLEIFNIISYFIHQVSMKHDFGADELTPILIYTILRWCPRRIYSNLNFIMRFQHDYMKKEKDAAGYYTQCILSAVYFLEELTHGDVKLDALEFEKNVHHAEVKHDVYFLRSRPRKVTETIDFSDYRQRKKLKNNQKS